MSCVILASGENFTQCIPSSLTRVTFKDISVALDTTIHYVQGKVSEVWQFHTNPKRKFLKVKLEEDCSDLTIMMYLLMEIAEKCKDIQSRDLLVATGFNIDMKTSVVTDVNPTNHTCQLNISPTSKVATVWVQPGRTSGSNELSQNLPAVSSAAQVQTARSSSSLLLDGCPASRTRSSGADKTDNRSDVVKAPVATDPSGSKTAGCETVQKKGSLMTSPYEYEVIKNLKAHTRVNVFGVVKYVRPVSKTRGPDYTTMVSIIDQSCSDPRDKLKCLLFMRDAQALPQVNIGDIIRFHRLKIEIYNNELQAQGGPGFAWIAFSPRDDVTDIKPKSSSSASYTLTDDDKKKVLELIQWSRGDDSLLSQDPAISQADDFITLSSVTLGRYFNLVCQVVASCVVIENESMLLRVWDGTKVNIPTFEQDMSVDDISSRLVSDDLLTRSASGYIVDVWVYDDHFSTAKQVKPGNFVRLTNVHAMTHKFTEADHMDRTIPLAELCVHGGGVRYHRSLAVLEDTSSAVRRLKAVLEECDVSISDASHDLSAIDTSECFFASATQPEAVSSDGRGVVVSDDEIDVSEYLTPRSELPSTANTPSPLENKTCATSRWKEDSFLVAGSRKRSISSVVSEENGQQKRRAVDADVEPVSQNLPTQDNDERSSLESRDNRCLVKTATVIADHHHIERTRLCDVLSQSPPRKYRVRASVIDYIPLATSPRNILRLFCNECNFLGPVPDNQTDDQTEESATAASSTTLRVHDVEDGVTIYMCPTCNPCTEGGITAVRVLLKYIYMLQFVLDDGTGSLSAGLWRNEAVRFFHGIEPTDLLRSTGHFERVCQQLDKLCSLTRTMEMQQQQQSTEDGQEWKQTVASSSEKMECCLMSFTTHCGSKPGVAYQIFDTEFSLEENVL